VRYLCLIYDQEAHLEDMSVTERDAFVAEYAGFTEDLKASGRFLGGEPLLPAPTATTVRVRNGRPAISAGPAVDTPEQLGGYYLIEAHDLDDAVRIAARIPSARLGSIEVRPVRESS